jgi:methylthioribose-1-phosphate isomerase
VNLRWALDDVRGVVGALPAGERAAAAYARAGKILDDDVAACRAIADNGLPLLERARRVGRPVQVMTHCNAGWLATVDWGTALAPVFLAHDRGVPVHVWVSETRPRNQGALTSWELASHGVPHTVVVDNAAGILLARGEVDVVIVGSDRTTARGDVVNKVGTYLKALAANAAGVPFYAAVPGSTIDFSIERGADVEIEERGAEEVTRLGGAALFVEGAGVYNPAFDVTPAELVSGIVTERGVAEAAPESLRSLYPERG